MPEVANTIGVVPDPTPPSAIQTDPSLSDTIGAAFSIGNDVSNAYQFLSQRHSFPVDPTFNLRKTLETDNLFDTNNQDFVGVGSQAAYDARKAAVLQDQKAQDVLARSGKTGIAAGLGAGLFSPTMFLPFIGEARGLRGVTQTVKNSLMAAAIAEVPILANHPGKPMDETLFDMGTATVLGAILGGAHVVMTPGERSAITGALGRDGGMGIVHNTMPISNLGEHAVGSEAAIAPGAGGFASGAGTLQKIIDSNQLTRSPVTFNIAGESDQVRWATAQLDDAGLTLERNIEGIPTTPGGTVSNRVNLYYALKADASGKLDNMYKDYYFKGDDPGMFGGLKATIGGMTSAPDRMSKAQFNSEVTRAGWSGDVHDNPQVQEAAQYLRKTVFDPILDRLQSAGLLGDNVNVIGDKSYVHRLFNTQAILRDTNGFVQFLSNHYEKKLNASFAKDIEKLSGKAAKDKSTISDLQMTSEQVAEAKAAHLAKLEEVNAGRSPELTTIEDQLGVHRAGLYEAQSAHRALGTSAADIAAKLEWEKNIAYHKDSIKGLEAAGGQGLTDVRSARKALQDRITGLGRAQGVLKAKQLAKLEKANAIEDKSIESLRSIARAGQTFLNKLDRLSDAELDKELSVLHDKFAKLGAVFDRGEERLGKMRGELQGQNDFIGPLSNEEIVGGLNTERSVAGVEAGQTKRAGKLSDAADAIASSEGLDRDQIRAEVGNQLENVIQHTQDLNARRAVREAKLREEAKALDPKQALDRIVEIQRRGAEREANFLADTRERGGNDVHVDRTAPAYRGSADFHEHAQRAAKEVKDKILGTTLRSPTIDMMQGDRAAVLARVLDVASHDMSPWLETNIEHILDSYLRTSGPDIEIAKKFGDVGAEKWLGNEGKIVQEQNARLAAIETQLDKRGRPLSQEAKAKEQLRINNQYALYRKNLEAIIKRLRHQDGVPADPNAMGYRLGKAALNINVLRYMGGVTLSSLPDVARVVMRYGATRVFRDGFMPMMKNFQGFKMSMQEAKYAGAANEVVSNMRSRSINNVFDDMHRGTKFEKGLDWMASKQGIVGLFAHWTDQMKMFTGVVANAKLMDSIAEVMTNGGTAKSREFLAANGIGGGEAAQIWEQALKNGGAQRVNGVWMPNTEVWDDGPAREAFRSALAREVNNQIVTPGVERPLWMTGSMTGRLLGQFKSFTFSSTQKMLMAGLQQRDMAVAQGMAVSLAFGALSYYLYAITAGGKTEEDMRSATLGKFADEAISRSGIEGAFGLGQDLLSRIPATQGFSSFSGGRTLRHGGGSLVEALAGPTFDAVSEGAKVVSEANAPDASTWHAARKLTPYQNVTGVRRIYDMIENAMPTVERHQ